MHACLALRTAATPSDVSVQPWPQVHAGLHALPAAWLGSPEMTPSPILLHCISTAVLCLSPDSGCLCHTGCLRSQCAAGDAGPTLRASCLQRLLLHLQLCKTDPWPACRLAVNVVCSPRLCLPQPRLSRDVAVISLPWCSQRLSGTALPQPDLLSWLPSSCCRLALSAVCSW